jgi:hypothetical protein
MIRPPKSVLLQYVYDYGLDKAAALFHIDIETADKIINWKPQYDLHIPEHTRSLSGSLLGYKTIP